MSGPWEQFQEAPVQEAGPWDKFAKTSESAKPETPPKKYLPDATPSTHAGRITHGAEDMFMGLGQIASHFGMDKVNKWIDQLNVPGIPKAQNYDQVMRDRQAEYERSRAAAGSKGFDWDRLAGNALTSALPMSPAINAVGMPARMALGAAGGAASAGMMPVESGKYIPEKLKQMETGGAFGAAGPVAGRIAERAVAPKLGQAASTLAEKGINITPGMAGGRVAKSVEDKLTSIPLIGDVIKYGQRKSIESFNRAAANDALKEIGETLPKNVKPGFDLIRHVEGKLSARYDSLLPKMQGRYDSQLDIEIANVLNKSHELPEAEQKAIEAKVNEIIGQFIHGQTDGSGLKLITRSIGEEQKNFGKAQDAFQNKASGLFKELKDSVDSMIRRQNPKYRAELTKIDTGWAKFKRLQRAQGLKDEAFAPIAASRAVKALDQSKDKGAYQRGGALMQGLTKAATEVMPSQVPDSGTTGRYLLDAALLGGAHEMGAGGMMAAHPLATGAGGLTALLYTEPGLRLLRQYLTPNQIRQLAGQTAGAGVTAAAPMIPQRTGAPQQ